MLSQTLGLQNVRESVCWSLPKAVCFIRRLYSSPSFNRQPPAKGVYNVLEAGVYRGLARYAWLRMVRNQVIVMSHARSQESIRRPSLYRRKADRRQQRRALLSLLSSMFDPLPAYF